MVIWSNYHVQLYDYANIKKICKPQNENSINSHDYPHVILKCAFQSNSPPQTLYTCIKVYSIDLNPVWGFQDSCEWQKCFSLSLSPSLCHSVSLSLSLSISTLFSQENKNCSSHSDREQRKTWPGPVTFGASWLVEAHRVSFVAVWTARQAVLWALPWTQSYLSSPVRADLHRRL